MPLLSSAALAESEDRVEKDSDVFGNLIDSAESEYERTEGG